MLESGAWARNHDSPGGPTGCQGRRAKMSPGGERRLGPGGAGSPGTHQAHVVTAGGTGAGRSVRVQDPVLKPDSAGHTAVGLVRRQAHGCHSATAHKDRPQIQNLLSFSSCESRPSKTTSFLPTAPSVNSPRAELEATPRSLPQGGNWRVGRPGVSKVTARPAYPRSPCLAPPNQAVLSPWGKHHVP